MNYPTGVSQVIFRMGKMLIAWAIRQTLSPLPKSIRTNAELTKIDHLNKQRLNNLDKCSSPIETTNKYKSHSDANKRDYY